MPYQAYQAWGQQTANDRVEAHLPLVYSLASSLAPRAGAVGIELGDLVQIGVLGLYTASDSFDAERGTTFGSFAKPFVRGAMLDEIAKHKNESRAVRDKFRRLREAEDKLLREFMREPTMKELAGAIGIDEKMLSGWQVDIGMREDASLEDLVSNTAFEPPAVNLSSQPELSFLRSEEKASLVAALGHLSQRYQQVLYLYYQEELTLKEIGYVLDLSESQISRTHKKAIEKLKELLAD